MTRGGRKPSHYVISEACGQAPIDGALPRNHYRKKPVQLHRHRAIGEKNGMFRHGRHTPEAKELGKMLRTLARDGEALVATVMHALGKPPPVRIRRRVHVKRALRRWLPHGLPGRLRRRRPSNEPQAGHDRRRENAGAKASAEKGNDACLGGSALASRISMIMLRPHCIALRPKWPRHSPIGVAPGSIRRGTPPLFRG
jgi:hypothetical protein